MITDLQDYHYLIPTRHMTLEHLTGELLVVDQFLVEELVSKWGSCNAMLVTTWKINRPPRMSFAIRTDDPPPLQIFKLCP